MAEKIIDQIRGGGESIQMGEYMRSSFNNLEEIGRSISLLSIMVYEIRFDSSAIGRLYEIVEEASMLIVDNGHEKDLEKLRDSQKNLIEFIYYIVKFAKQKNLSSIDKSIIDEVRSNAEFCPVYPFDNWS